MKINEALFRVVDTETTGFDAKEHKVCELAMVDVKRSAKGWQQGSPQSWLCNPGRPIPPEAKAIHHITDRMVQDAPAVLELFGYLQNARPAEGLVYVAHNAEFDRAMLEAAGFPPGRWLCTWRLAMHVWPLAPSYKNEALRYWLGYDTLPWEKGAAPAGQTHRAAHDVAVTALVLSRMLLDIEELAVGAFSENSTDALIAWADSPVLLTGKMGFGKHGDLTWPEVGAMHVDYLQWMIREEKKKPGSWDKDKLHTAKHYANP
jgi:exodeoxyribonuclease X